MVKPGVTRLREKLEFARKMRKNPTKAEAAFWEKARKSALGFKVRRQVRVYGFIADFYIPAKSLIVEIDGGYHLTKEQSDRDEMRDQALKAKALAIIHVTNDEVFQNFQSIVDRISAFPDLVRHGANWKKIGRIRCQLREEGKVA